VAIGVVGIGLGRDALGIDHRGGIEFEVEVMGNHAGEYLGDGAAIHQIRGADQNIAQEDGVPGRDQQVAMRQALAEGVGADADGADLGAGDGAGVAVAANPAQALGAVDGGDFVADGEGFDAALAAGGVDVGAG